MISGLETLVAEHPYREHLWAQLITAYYVAERQTDALDAHRRVRSTLSKESLWELFALIRQYPFWTEDDGLSVDSMNFVIDMATEPGVLAQPMDAGDVVDRATLDRAVALANQPPGR